MPAKIWTPPIKGVPRHKWVCLWVDEHGKFVAQVERGTIRYLSAESWTKGDKEVEAKMKIAARHYGIDTGGPVWTAGEKISDMEHDDQMERLLDGKIPDPAEEYRNRIEEILGGNNDDSGLVK